MLRKATTFTTFRSTSREANLYAAKQALKRHRGAYLHRDTTSDDDVIDIVIGVEIMERHIFKCAKQAQPRPIRHFRIEDMALYQ